MEINSIGFSSTFEGGKLSATSDSLNYFYEVATSAIRRPNQAIWEGGIWHTKALHNDLEHCHETTTSR